MAYAMTKQGSLDNCVTYEFICDAVEDMNAIEDRYRTIGSIAIVLQGASGLEVYISGSNKQWNSLSSIGGGTAGGDTAGLAIHICAQDEVSNGLPDIELPDETTIYLVPASDASSGNLYDEYIYVDDKWEKFGSANIDLSGYYQKPVSGIPAADLASGVIPDVSGFAPKDSPVFTGSINMGRAANSTVGTNSVAIGGNVTASGSWSHAECSNTNANGVASHAEGTSTTASGESSHSEGAHTTASGQQSHAEGNYTNASAYASHAEGANTKASGQTSHAEGTGGSYTKNNVTYVSEALGQADHIEGYQTRTASNQPGNHAEGYQTAALGGAAHAEGQGTIASGSFCHAEGNNTTASEAATHAEGSQTIASSYAAHAEGNGTTASGASAHAEGQNVTASGDISHAEGMGTVASGALSHAEGSGTIANLTAMHAGGRYNAIYPDWVKSTNYSVGDLVVQNSTLYKCKTANSDATFIAKKWEAAKQYLVVIGNGTTNNNRSNAYALNQDGNGYFAGDVYVNCNADSTGGSQVAPTENPVFTGSISMGRLANSTIGTKSVAIGKDVTASGYNSYAEGTGSSGSFTINNKSYQSSGAYGQTSHSEGNSTWAIGQESHAEGRFTQALDMASHSEGNSTQAIGVCSHAEGEQTQAKGNASHAEGYGGTYTKNNVMYTSGALGQSDHTEGYQTRTESNQPGNHAEGYRTSAIGGASHAEGNATTASGNSSHAEGADTTASNYATHAEGSSTTASGTYAHAEGTNTIADGEASHAEGWHTTANLKAMHASGEYNISYSNWFGGSDYKIDDLVVYRSTLYKCKTANSDTIFDYNKWIDWSGFRPMFVIGNGSQGGSYSNACTIDKIGNEYLMGDLYVGCHPNSTGGTKLPRIPEAPSADGVYTLQATVSNGTVTYSWIAGA